MDLKIPIVVIKVYISPCKNGGNRGGKRGGNKR
jgi:hypothetical protein